MVGRSRSGDLNVDLAATEGVSYLFGSTVQAVAEGVVVTWNLVSLLQGQVFKL